MNMPALNLAQNKIVQRFDRAAEDYDAAADMQRRMAQHLVERVAKTNKIPNSVLDIGSGTGFVATMAAKAWPQAHIMALDASRAMLRQIRSKLPLARLIEADAAIFQPNHSFDLIFSNMALHWFKQPRAMLERWQGWLAPGGALHVALLVEGSFRSWQDLCARQNVANGLWPLPSADFAADFATAAEHQTISISYPSAKEFLHRLKIIGASSPRPGYRPISSSAMRRLLDVAPYPFAVNYEVLHLTIASATV
jgi:malonyl-CoA O-methyltransferase